MRKDRQAVVLLTGAVDSFTALAIAGSEGFPLNALSFRYGQRHEVELNAASSVVEKTGVNAHVTMNIDLRQFGGSVLTAEFDVPKRRSASEV